MDNADLLREIDIEIADTPELRSKGLQHRDDISPDSGMLFDYGKESDMAFWGKNTLMPLDIAFLKGNGQIISIKSIKPMSGDSVMSPPGCRYALEVPKGQFDKHGIGPGCHCRHNGRRLRFYRVINDK